MIRIGISGWRYPPWRGVFYPEGLAQIKELHFASRALSTIEINGSFYSLQTPASYQRWYDETPENFIFSVKCPRFITHMKQLNDIKKPLANFFASGVLNLEEKLGPFLWQFPAQVKFHAAKFAAFYALLPKTKAEAKKLARFHDHRVTGRCRMVCKTNGPLRHCVEIRDESFDCPEFFELCRKFNVAVVVADTAGKWPLIEEMTSDFAYLRLHGDKVLYASGYSRNALKGWTKKIRRWQNLGSTTAKVRDVFVYFDNDVKVRAPFDAFQLSKLLKVGTGGWSAAGLPGRPSLRVSEEPRTNWRL